MEYRITELTNDETCVVELEQTLLKILNVIYGTLIAFDNGFFVNCF